MTDNIPTKIVDFAQAIREICNSQADVQELVSKWNDIINDSVPKVVTIRLTSGEYAEIKNLAMVENELREAVRETYPNINKARVSFEGGSASAPFSAIYGATSSHGRGRFASSLTGIVGWTKSSVNDFYIYHNVETSSSHSTRQNPKTVLFSQLPRMVALVDNPSVTESFFSVTPIKSGDTDFDVMYNGGEQDAVYHYACISRFINHSGTKDYTLHLLSNGIAESEVTITIPKRVAGSPLNYADVLFWCGKGGDIVYFELMNGGGATYAGA